MEEPRPRRAKFSFTRRTLASTMHALTRIFPIGHIRIVPERDVFTVVADPTRRRILDLLREPA